MASRPSASAGMRLGVGKAEEAAASSEKYATANYAAGVSCSPGMTRIYMGGLGGAVTEADVEKTFAPLGRVSRFEFVRNKGRSFAFMDFEPKSDKSLAKLFSTYNGCIWKGGRLKLEKAKEHYHSRLRREWAEDAESSKNQIVVDMNKGLVSSDKSRSMAKENMQLQIFFPKLRKVKALPFKGSGKHKYSFQRIATPSLPVHFCDCEEHAQSPEDPNQDQPKYIKDQTVVVNEKELIIMNSVMKKLFEKEANGNVADSKAFLATESDILDDSKNEAQFGDSEAGQQSDSDPDNLVTNIGLGNGEDVLNLMWLKGWGAASPEQEPNFGKSQYSHDGLNSQKQNTRKRQITGPGTASEVPCRKRAHLPSEKSKESKISTTVDGKIVPQETEHQELNDLPSMQSRGSNYPTDGPDIMEFKTAQNLAFGRSAESTSCIQKLSSTVAGKIGPQEMEHQELSDLPSIQSQGSNHPIEGPDIMESKTTQDLAFGQSARSTSWIQKSSWKELVGDSGSSTFTISHVLPGVNSVNARLSKSNGAENIRSTAERMGRPHSGSNHLKPMEVTENIPGMKIAAPGREEKSSNGDEKYVVDEGGLDKAPRSSSYQEPKTDAPKIGVGQVCTFMRSAESVKEWTKTKAALSGHSKKKKKQQQQRQHGAGTS